MSLDDSELSALIRRHATRHEAPDALRAGLRTQVALAEAGRAPAPQAPPAVRPRRRWLPAAWTGAAGFALGLLCMALLQPLVLPWSRLQGDGQPAADWRIGLEDELVARHVRALGAGPLIEVASSDRHTVKPWFQGRVDFAPPVFDLAADGFPLLGGRVEPLRGRPLATLAYARHRHVIDLFIRPSTELGAAAAFAASSASAAAAAHSQRQGFTLMHWDDGAMQYWLVSDLERSEAEAFVQHWRQHAAAQ